MKLFVIHPGWVPSDHDNQQHFISARKLMWLYDVDQDECIVWDKKRTSGYYPEYLEKLEHLYPVTGEYPQVTDDLRREICARLGI